MHLDMRPHLDKVSCVFRPYPGATLSDELGPQRKERKELKKRELEEKEREEREREEEDGRKLISMQESEESVEGKDNEESEVGVEEEL
jgi:hypothetical protein